MRSSLLEVCVDSYESAVRAARGGAQRLELCANLMIGGTSPSFPLIRQVHRAVEIPVNVLLRPRFGDFCHTAEEKQVLLEEIDFCADEGVNGVVIGALTPEGELDMEFLARCVRAAKEKGLKFTLHRCFDVCRDPMMALEQAVRLGFDTILTSGQEATAPKGAALLARLNEAAGDRIHIMAGSGVNPENIRQLYGLTGITHFHMSAKRTEPGPMLFRNNAVPMGLPIASEYDRQYCDAQAVASARAVLDSIDG